MRYDMSLLDCKIVEVNYGEINGVYPRLIGRNGKLPEVGYVHCHEVVTLKTDTGFTGWGLGYMDRTLQILLEGAKLSDLFHPEVGVLLPELCGADMALHDLVGKILGIPVAKMLNPDTNMKATCYDGAIYLNDITNDGDKGVQEVLRNCHQDVLMGMRDFKVKIGRGKRWMEKEAGLRRDVEIVRSIRKEFPTSRILVDANDMMNLETIIAFMEQVKDCSIYWVEEPFVENYKDCMALKEYLRKESPKTLLADGEFDWDADFVVNLAKKGALDVFLMDPISYGFTAWRKLIKECAGTPIKCSPHGWGTIIKTNVVAHLAAAYPEVCPTVEWAPDTVPCVDVSGYIIKEGIMTLPEKPGFGMDLQWMQPKKIFKPY